MDAGLGGVELVLESFLSAGLPRFFAEHEHRFRVLGSLQVANGGVDAPGDAERCFQETGCAWDERLF